MTKIINHSSQTRRGQTNIQTISNINTYCPTMLSTLSGAAGLEKSKQKTGGLKL